MQETIDNQNQKILTLKATIDDQTNEINSLNSFILQLQQIISDKDVEISGLKQTIADQQAQINNLLITINNMQDRIDQCDLFFNGFATIKQIWIQTGTNGCDLCQINMRISGPKVSQIRSVHKVSKRTFFKSLSDNITLWFLEASLIN